MLTFADRDLSLGDLEAVLAVYEYGQFTRAGKVLDRSQPSVSHSVQTVESSVRALLFDRTTRPIEHTPLSGDFLYELRKGLYFLERAFTKLHTRTRAASAIVEVGHSTYFDTDLLTYLTHLNKALHTEFSAIYHSSFTAEIVANVLAGVWDCGFVLNPGETCGLEVIPLMHDPLGLLIANSHPLTRRRRIDLRDIADEPLIVPVRDRNPAFRTWFLERCAAAGFVPKIVQEISHPHEAARLTEQHVGLSLVTRATAKHAPRGSTVFRPFADSKLAVEVQLVLRAEIAEPSLRSFVDAVLTMRERIVRREPVQSEPVPIRESA
jgi:DNA-binding transcriptional LysR family regulator